MLITKIFALQHPISDVIKLSSIRFIGSICFFIAISSMYAQKSVRAIYEEINKIEQSAPSKLRIERLYELSEALIDSAKYDQLLHIYELAYAKSKSLEDVPGEIKALVNIANEYSMIGSYTQASQYADSIIIRRSVNDSLRKVAFYIKGVASSVTGDYNEAIDALKQGIQIPVELTNEIEFYDYLSYSYSGIGQYKEAIAICFTALDRLQKKQPQGYRHFSQFYHNLGLIYLQTEDFEAALEKYEVALAYNIKYEQEGLPEAFIQSKKIFARSKRIPIFLELGSLYKNLDQPDSSISLFNKAKQLTLTTGSKNREIRLSAIGIALADIYNMLGQYTLALQELSQIEEYFTSGKLENYTEYVQLLIGQGVAFNGLEQYDQALFKLIKALNKSEEIEVEDVNTITSLFYALANVYESKGNHEQSLRYFKAVKVHQDSIFNLEKAKTITELEARYETLEKEKLLIESNVQKQKLRNQLLLVSIGALLFLTVSITLYRLSKRKQRDNLLLEQKNTELESSQKEVKRLMEREKELLRQELENKERELAVLAINANEMDQFLHSFKRDLDTVDSTEIKHLTKQINNQLSTEKSWKKFVKHFESVHPEFFSRLKADFSQLTNHDLKLSAYIRIGMDNKEIASMTGIDHNSARNSVYRLKKKLMLGSEQSIRDFITNY